MLTAARLREVLCYYPESGFFVWRKTRGKSKAGSVAGTLHESRSRANSRYLVITVDKKAYPAHRLAWLYMTGTMPPSEVHVDHKNTSSLDNRWDNLRLATHTQNQWNRGAHADGKLGIRGVDQHRGKYRARITKNGKRVTLGYWTNPEAADAAYKAASERLHGAFCAR